MDLLSALSADLPAASVALALGVSFLGSLVTASFGIGGGVLVLATLASLLPPAALIPVHGLVQLGSNATRAALFWRHIAWTALPAFLVGSVLGIALGGYIAVEIPPNLVQAGVGAFVIWSVLARPPRWLRRWPVVAGAISSFLTMFFGATGPFVAVFVKSRNLKRHAHVATHATIMSFHHGLKVVVFGALGFAFAPWLALIAAMIGAGVLGTLTGKRILGSMDDRGFKRALDLVLIAIGARLIWVGFASL